MAKSLHLLGWKGGESPLSRTSAVPSGARCVCAQRGRGGAGRIQHFPDDDSSLRSPQPCPGGAPVPSLSRPSVASPGRSRCVSAQRRNEPMGGF